MEIKASQRRGPARAHPPLHQKLARRRAWQQRLVYGGVLALLTSLIAWVAGASLALHLGLVVLAFALGLGWRFGETNRRAERWAFSWIEDRSGLAYLSAFELPETAKDSLADAVRGRAAKTERLDTPPLQPWALPLLVLALVLALAPHLALPALRAPFASSGPAQPDILPDTVPTPEETTLEPDATTQDAATTDAASAPADGADATPNTPTSPETAPDAERSFDTATGAEQPGEAGGEQAALDRFLEETEAAEVSPMETQRGPSQSATPTGQTQRSGAPGEPGSEGAQPGTASPDAASGADPNTDSGTDPGATPDETAQTAAGEGEGIQSGPSSQEPDEGAQSDDEARQTGDSGQSDAEEEGDASAQGPEAPPEAPNEQPGTAESQRAESATPESDPQDESSARTGEPTVPRGGTSNEDAEATQDVQDGQSSERGGNRGGADIAGSRERLGGSERTPERITGIRGDGPTTAGGEALQQGQTPDTLPRTGTPESYRRAAEEVVREGRIPLEYQEIIRDYFR